MKILSHPTFMRTWTRLFAGAVAYFAISVGGTIYLGNHGYSGVAQSVLWFVLLSNVLALIGIGALPFLVRCAACHGSTQTKSRRRELPDSWSAHCRSCDVLWDLRLGNGD